MDEPIVEVDPSVKRSFLMKNMALEQKVTGGNDFLFWREANAIQSAQRIDALNAEFCTLRGECGKFAVELCVKNGVPEDKKTKAELLAELGFCTEECQVLVEEYVKSAAELCIKKMRLGALVDKCNKQRTLINEVITTKKQWAEIWRRFAVFRKNLLTSRKQLQEDSHAHVNAEENDLGRAPEKSPEIPRSQIRNMESGLSNVKFGGLSNATFGSRCSFKAVVLRRESFRVMVEMMRGVKKFGQQQDKRLDNALALGKQWSDALVRHCLIKLWVGTFVERLSVYEVLKREIAEHWKMEKELKDRIVAYRSEHACVEGGGTIKGERETSGVGGVVDGDKTVEAKKSEGNSVVEGDKAMKKKKSRVGTVLEGEETVQEKNEGVALGGGGRGLTKHHVVEGDEAIKEKNKLLKNKRRKTSEGDEAIKEKNKTLKNKKRKTSEGDEVIKEKSKTLKNKKRKTSGKKLFVEGDEAMKEKKSGVGTVLEGEDTVELKKSEGSSVVVGDEAMKEKESRVGTVLEVEETVQEKKNEGVALGEGALVLTKHHVVEGDQEIK